MVQVAHGQAHGVDDAVHARDAVGVNHVVGKSVAIGIVALLGLMLEAVGKHRQDVDGSGFQPGNEVVNEGQVSAHPVGAIEQQADAGPCRVEPGPYVIVKRGSLGHGGMVHALPGHRGRSLMAVVAAQVGVSEEQEQVAEIKHAAAHQVGKDGFNFGDGSRAGGDQVFVPFLVSGAGDQRDAVGAANFDQQLKYVAQRPATAQQAERHYRGAGHRLQQFLASGRGGLALALQVHRVAGIDADRVAPRHTGQGALGRQEVGVGGGYQHNAAGRILYLRSHDTVSRARRRVGGIS